MRDDSESFHEYVRARTPALFRVAYLLCGDGHLAEELVQQALIRVASRWERIISGGEPEAYLRKVIYHQHISWWRRRSREAIPIADIPDQPAPDHAAGLATSLSIQNALRELTAKQRAVLVLRFYEDLTESQTAQVLGCSVNTVKKQARGALARMRALLPEFVEAVR